MDGWELTMTLQEGRRKINIATNGGGIVKLYKSVMQLYGNDIVLCQLR